MRPDLYRCPRTAALAVAHRDPAEPPTLENAEVLCWKCLPAATGGYLPREPHAPFDEVTRQRALKRSEGRCECHRVGGCH